MQITPRFLPATKPPSWRLFFMGPRTMDFDSANKLFQEFRNDPAKTDVHVVFDEDAMTRQEWDSLWEQCRMIFSDYRQFAVLHRIGNPSSIIVKRITPLATGHVFSNTPEARQAAQGEEAVTSVFRPRYRALSDEEKALHDEIKTAAEALLRLYNRIPSGARYRSLAQTALEESVMWAVKELTTARR